MANKQLKTTEKMGRQIQMLREESKLSQIQLATAAGITRATLAEIEKGTANPSMETLMRVCRALNISLADLFLSELDGEQSQTILQPINGSLLPVLQGAMESGQYTFCQMLVAYAKRSGVELIAQSFHTMQKNGGSVTAYIGVDQKNTTAEALYQLLQICDDLYVVHDQAVAQTYHPKLYLLKNTTSMWVAVGSNNLTRGGLCTNYEACTIQTLHLASAQNRRLYEDIQETIHQYSVSSLVKRISTIEDIQQLLHAGLLSTEQESRMRIRKSAISNPSSFGHRPVHEIPVSSCQIPVPVGLFTASAWGKEPLQKPTTPSPLTTKSETSLVTAQAVLCTERSPDIQETAWFCAGKLTGGSRNILDLSESAILRCGTHPQIGKNNTIPGGVSFFGLDPKDHGTWKRVTILFDNIPYHFSTIKFAPGNSNWRFQLTGDPETGKAALSKFGSSFINQILLFHRISDDFYILEVMEESELPVLQKNSRFWATNGKMKTGRPFGVLDV